MLAVQPGTCYQIIMGRKRRCHHTSCADRGRGTCLGRGFGACTPDQIPTQIYFFSLLIFVSILNSPFPQCPIQSQVCSRCVSCWLHNPFVSPVISEVSDFGPNWFSSQWSRLTSLFLLSLLSICINSCLSQSVILGAYLGGPSVARLSLKSV